MKSLETREYGPLSENFSELDNFLMSIPYSMMRFTVCGILIVYFMSLRAFIWNDSRWCSVKPFSIGVFEPNKKKQSKSYRFFIVRDKNIRRLLSRSSGHMIFRYENRRTCVCCWNCNSLRDGKHVNAYSLIFCFCFWSVIALKAWKQTDSCNASPTATHLPNTFYYWLWLLH